MAASDIVIGGYAETPVVFGSGRSAYDLAADVLDELARKYGIAPADIDGLAVTAALSEGSNPFHAAFMSDALGLALDWLATGTTGGCAMLSAVAATASALRDGHCKVAFVLGADAPSTRFAAEFRGYHDEFIAPTGMTRPPGFFALVHNAYEQRYGALDAALGKIVLTQRGHALENERACEKLRRPLALDDYLKSRKVSDPLRLLDSVMFCDGANGVLMMRAETASAMGLSKCARLAGYAERTNHDVQEQPPDLLASGFVQAGPRALRQAGLTVQEIDMLQLYDDFTIAVLMQLEHLGFCGRGEGAAFVEKTDLRFSGGLPLNTGGGQLSAGQPGLAAGGLGLVEAVRQLFGEGGATQVEDPRNALVTGIGGLAYGRAWMMSSALVLDR
jgi:acetyl-CoA acetyltransferase|uniref:Putative thiolase n=1 Tax=Ralstonia pickettii TaxID=329 RepID=I3RYL3_RALPI|nr:thiolase family protein [Ralstonia pickettii]AFK33100.1 putative thiolase [Ralstonia pickettii]AFR43893.1 thiolase [uncultured bacterium]